MKMVCACMCVVCGCFLESDRHLSLDLSQGSEGVVTGCIQVPHPALSPFSLLLLCVARDSLLQIPVTVLSSCKPASDGEHLAMFIAVQVQREASSTMEQGKLAAAPLCGKHHHTPRNQNKDTEREKTLQGLRKLPHFPPFYFATFQFCRKHFLNTTAIFAKRSCGTITHL